MRALLTLSSRPLQKVRVTTENAHVWAIVDLVHLQGGCTQISKAAVVKHRRRGSLAYMKISPGLMKGFVI